MRARTLTVIPAFSVFALFGVFAPPAFAQSSDAEIYQQGPPAQPEAQPDTQPAEQPAASESAPAAGAGNAELPQINIVQEPQSATVAAPAKKKKASNVKSAASKKAKPKPRPVAQPAEPVMAEPVLMTSPDAIEAASRNPGQQTNAAAGAYSAIRSYSAEGSGFGTKTGTPLNETPQSISVVGKEQMRDQGVQNLQEAIRYTPGVLADGWGFDSRYDYSIIRGVAAAYFIDGLRSAYGYGVNASKMEPYALDRVEVLRGPSSMLYGQAPTGGLINGSSKLPVDVAYNEVGVDYGSFDYKQMRFDSTGRVTEDGKWLYRVTGLVRDADTYVDYVENDRLMIQPSITYRPTTDTSITVLGNYRRDRSGSTQQFLPQAGTLTPNVNGQRVSRDTFVGDPDDYYNTDQASVSLFVDHKFSDAVKLHHASRYTETDNSYKSTYAAVLTPGRVSFINSLFGLPLPNAPFLNADQTEIARALLLQSTDTSVFNTDTNLTAKFNTGPLKHQVLAGFDYMRFSSQQSQADLAINNLATTSTAGPFASQPVFDIYHPYYGPSTILFTDTGAVITPDQLVAIPRPHEVQSQTGLYIQDQIKAGPWIAVLGLRQDWLSISQAGSPDESDAATTGRAALMYEFDSGFTPYVSYSTSFNPLPGQPVSTDIYGRVLGLPTTPATAMEGKQIEIGFKYQPQGAPFSISAAAYKMQETNQIVQPDILFEAVQGADIDVRGFEAQFVGALTPNIKVLASYTYTDATWDKYPEISMLLPGVSALMEGRPVDGIPKHMASLWGVYSFNEGTLRGLSFGAGLRYIGQSESYGVDVTSRASMHVTTPSYLLVDGMIAYETPEWRWQLTGQNLADKYYVTSCTVFRGDCGLGTPRTLLTSFTYKF